MLDALDGGPGHDGVAEQVEEYLASDRYHDRIYEHHRNPHNEGGLDDPTLRKHSEETTCGDEGEFHVDVADGTIERIAFESQSCAVSRAVASILSEYLEGRTLEEAASLDGEVAAMLEGTFPDLRRDCVVGPEEVISEAAREYLDGERAAVAGDD
nr:iron-sulfur cluster assembly scaffold protein [Halorussus litoreus]